MLTPGAMASTRFRGRHEALILAVGLLPLGLLLRGPSPNVLYEFLTHYELGMELTCAGALGVAFFARPRMVSRGHHLSALASLLAFALGDWLVNSGRCGTERAPTTLLADVSFTLAWAAIAPLIATSAPRRQLSMWVLATRCIRLLGWACLVWLQYHFVLRPATAWSLRPGIFDVTSGVYAGLSSWVVVRALETSLRSLSRRDHLVCQSLLLAYASDFAIRYHSSSTNSCGGSWAEAGWAAGMTIMAATLALSAFYGGLPGATPATLARLFSLRTLVGGVSFFANSTLLGGVLLWDLWVVHDATLLTALLWLVLGAWWVANRLALYLSRQLAGIVRLMPASDLLKTAGGAESSLVLAEVHHAAPLGEFGDLLGHYNRLIACTNQLLVARLRAAQNTAVVRLAQQIAHEVQGPLTALATAIHRWPESTSTHDHEMRALAEDALSRMNETTQALLAPRKLSAATRADLVEAIKKGEQNYLLAADARHLRVPVTLVVPQKEGLFVTADGVLLARVVANLLENAEAATRARWPRGKKEIIIEVARHDGGMWGFWVVDQGLGLGPEAQAQLRAGEAPTQRRAGGHGLGLQFVLTCLKLWGGKLSVESAAERGTRIGVWLPAAAPTLV